LTWPKPAANWAIWMEPCNITAAPSSSPPARRILLELGFTYFAAGRLDEAREALGNCLRYDTEHCDALYFLRSHPGRSGRFRRRRRILSPRPEHRRRTLGHPRLLGKTLYHLGYYAEASENLQQSLQLDAPAEELPDLHYYLGCSHEALAAWKRPTTPCIGPRSSGPATTT